MIEESKWQPLPREEVVKAVEREKPTRIPLIRAKWWGEGLEDHFGPKLDRFDRYPEDVAWVQLPNPVDPDRMELSWEWDVETGAKDSVCVIDDWSKLDEFIEKLPRAEEDSRFEEMKNRAEEARRSDRYLMFGWWNLFFERPWMLRGMQTLMLDFHRAKEELHRLYSAMCETYISYIERGAELLNPDGFWTSDDLGQQTGPMMSPETFEELLYPYYAKVGEALERTDMHFWLHSCGDNTPLLPYLIEAGVDVFHPVQKGTMDEREVAKEFGDSLAFLAGIDVQHALQEKDPAGVREEVRFLIDTFDREDGGMCLAAGNGILPGTPLENIEAFLNEALIYGSEHRRAVS